MDTNVGLVLSALHWTLKLDCRFVAAPAWTRKLDCYFLDSTALDEYSHWTFFVSIDIEVGLALCGSTSLDINKVGLLFLK